MPGIKKISFRKVGKKNRHHVTLFAIGEKDPAEMFLASSDEQSYAAETINHYREQCVSLLKQNGIDPHSNCYRVEKGKVVALREGTPIANSLTLLGAIQERDGAEQTEDFLAALVLCHIALATIARHETEQFGHTPTLGDVILDNALAAQKYFFDLYLLKNIQRQFSAGKSRIDAANKAHELRPRFEDEARALFIEFLDRKHTKARSYSLIAARLKAIYPATKTPSAETIRSWLKSDQNLR